MEDFKSLLKVLGTSCLSRSAYETAWIARLGDIAPEMSRQALGWLSRNQLPDGSWGSERPMYYHDRVICTLSAMIAFMQRGRRAEDQLRIERGIQALGTIAAGATRGLTSDPNGATVGFELSVPALVAEAERLGLIKQQKEHILGRISHMRAAKMAKLAGRRISRHVTLAHSAELAGQDNMGLLDIDNLQEENGSVGDSPSATAYFALYVKPGDESALNYLRSVTKGGNEDGGGAPTLFPIEIFERVWVLWNLFLTGLHQTDDEIKALCAPHMDYLETHWKPGEGLAFSKSFTPVDGDDTNVGFEILSKFGRNPDLSAVLNSEEEKWFRCYKVERDPSIDVNVHALGALRQVGYDAKHPSVQKILAFIRSTRYPGGYWLDKWNLSPYYTTAHIIILCKGYDDELCQESVDWIVNRQQTNGSWASYGFPSAEETAYCIQALKTWQMYKGNVSKDTLQKAKGWLSRHCDPPYPPFWIGKSLYCPETMAKSAIISALALVEL